MQKIKIAKFWSVPVAVLGILTLVGGLGCNRLLGGLNPKGPSDQSSGLAGLQGIKPPARSKEILAAMKKSFLGFCQSTSVQKTTTAPKRQLQDFTVAQVLRYQGVPRGQIQRVFSEVITFPTSYCAQELCAEVFRMKDELAISRFLDETYEYSKTAPQLAEVGSKNIVLGSLLPEDSAANSFHEPYRPQFHFSPKAHWMNDPNGMFYYNGTYHLFYQYYPQGTVWGPMHWGHAVSPDLINWQEKPIALKPDAIGQIYSGSVVVDLANTSGLKSGPHPPIVAIFSHNTSDDIQHQSLAYSNDLGETWVKYQANPVIVNPGLKAFRDPKVFWHDATGKWVMVLAADDQLMIYSSSDLKDWKHESSFGKGLGAHGGVWECPDLVPFKVKGTHETRWVMFVSLNPGGIAGGSGTQYFVGQFDGRSFKADPNPSKVRWLDYGADNYAGVTFFETKGNPEKKTFLAWMSNWQYAPKVPTQGWRGAMTVPREMSLIKNQGGYELLQVPVPATKNLRDQENAKIWGGQTLRPGQNILSGYNNRQVELIADFDVHKSSATTFGFKVRKGNGQFTSISYDRNQGRIVVDRTHSGKIDFAREFSAVHSAPITPIEGKLRIHLLVDWSSIEVFVNDGRVVITDLIFPDHQSGGLEVFGTNGQVQIVRLEMYPLLSTKH